MQVWMKISLFCLRILMIGEVIRQTLIRTYLQDVEQDIENLLAEEEQIKAYRQELLQSVEHAFSLQKSIEPSQAEIPIRKAGFRQAIMRIYDYTCAVCQLYVLTLDGESITEAAHIVPLSQSYNNDVRNGISLCKSHHWAFEKGLISLSRTYEVIVSELMLERGPAEWKLTALRGKGILLPDREALYPAQEALAWHRENIFSR